MGKDEPHPVALLPPSRHFPTHLLVDRRLRLDEAFEIERVGYLRLLSRRDFRGARLPLRALKQLTPGLNRDRHCDPLEQVLERNTCVFRRSLPLSDDDSVSKLPALAGC